MTGILHKLNVVGTQQNQFPKRCGSCICENPGGGQCTREYTYTYNASYLSILQSDPFEEGPELTVTNNAVTQQWKRNLVSIYLGICGDKSEFLATDSEVPGPIPGASRIFWVAAGLERGPLSLVRTTEELREGKVAAPD
jgi:hypothetical protein